MKVYVIPVAPQFQPVKQPFRYPKHNDDYGVEQDFLVYVNNSSELIAAASKEADWSYLPIFWTRWHMNHDYAAHGLDELQVEVKRALDGARRVFTICQYDDGPVVDVGETLVFYHARKTSCGRDVPTLCAAHKWTQTLKRFRACFVGRLRTHPVRQQMALELSDRQDVLILDGDFGEDTFVDALLSSYIALCPRGYGGGSFRFYEAMQLGVVPVLVHDIDTRPFKHVIDWDSCSFYSPSVSEVKEILDRFDEEKLQEMGRLANAIYHEHLVYQKWCPHVIEELETA